MKKIVFFDTETTGLVQEYGAPTENQPEIVQFGAIVVNCDDDGNIESEQEIDLFFKPQKLIPQRLTDIHGISNEMVADKDPFSVASKDLVALFRDCDHIVGHNVAFDRKMIFVEMDRVWKKPSPEKTEWQKQFKKKEIDTMEAATDFCEIKSHAGGNKFPRLIELHQKLFNKWFDGAHNAIIDTIIPAVTLEIEKLKAKEMKTAMESLGITPNTKSKKQQMVELGIEKGLIKLDPQVVPYVIEYDQAMLERFLELSRRIVKELSGQPLIDENTGIIQFLPNPYAAFGAEESWLDFSEEVGSWKVWTLSGIRATKPNRFEDVVDALDL